MTLARLDISSIVSTGNQSTDTLSGGATFTGTAELNSALDVMVSCFSNTAGVLHFDFSINGTDWREFPSSGFVVSAGIHEFHTAVKGPRYFRVRFVNGSVAQTSFQLQTYYGDFRQPSAPLNQTVGLDADALLVRPTFPWMDIIRGHTSGITFINKFGQNEDCSVGDTIDISQTPIDLPATAELCNIVSTDAADDGSPEGAGAFTVQVQGLDENYDLAEETVTLNGTTNVSTVNRYWFVYRMYVVTGADYAGNDGVITCTSTDAGAAVLATIKIGANQTESANFQIPAGHKGYFNLPQITLQNTNNNSVVELALYKREFGGVDRIQIDFLLQSGATADYQQKSFGAPLIFNEKDIIYWKVLSVATGTNNVTVDYDIWLVNES